LGRYGTVPGYLSPSEVFEVRRTNRHACGMGEIWLAGQTTVGETIRW